MNKKHKTMVLIFLLGYIVFVGALYVMQRSMIYFPDPRRITPAEVGRNDMDVVNVVTADGLTLEGWYHKPQSPDKPVLVLFHGNADHHAFTVPHMEPYIDHGYGVLLTEYRGYAGNPGTPDEQGLYEDGRAWIKWLIATGIKPADIILYGQSLGTGVATQMALDFPSSRALILYAPFTSLPNVAKKTYFFVPVDMLMKDRFSNIDKIAHISMPVFIINGLNDTVVPPEQGKALYAAAPQPKSLVQIDGAGHVDIPAGIVSARIEHFLNGITAVLPKPSAVH